MPNGVQIDLYDPSYANNGGYVLFGGRLVNIKGLYFLIMAFSMIRKKLQKEYSLMIVGYGPEEKRLKKLSMELGIRDKVHFIPWLAKSQFVKVIQNASVIVLPSLYEASPMFALESMACGKPVIASDIPAMRDLITHMYNGVLFKRGNVVQLKNCLELLLENPDLKLQLGRNARKTIEEKYSFEKVASEYIKIFQACAKKH